MTAILGISAFYHDSAAALVVDGHIVAAAQEERFSRKKHDASFPGRAVDACLREAELHPDDLDYVVFYEKPLLKFERLLETHLTLAPAGFPLFRKAIPVWTREKLFLPRQIRKALGGIPNAPLVYPEHHESHAASAFFPSPFDEAAIATIDGVGEWATTTLGAGKDNRIELHRQIDFPHSLGLLYSAFTYYTGFRVNSGEYKLMGLAPYGRPIYADRIRGHLVDIKPDGSFRLDMRYFNYCRGLTMTNRRFHRLFGRPPRQPESGLEEFHMDVAASIQAVTEEILFKLVRHLHALTPSPNLCLAGGVALNCVANGKILRETPFEHVWIQPAAGDAGGALGAALFTWHHLLENERRPRRPDAQRASYLGPGFDDAAIVRELDKQGVVYTRYDDENALAARIAELLADRNVVGLHHGRMEFGPRALGARSILGDPRSPDMQRIMNLKIKFRESFRPFAPSVLQERVHTCFDMRENEDSPYMLMVAEVADSLKTSDPDTVSHARGLDKLQVPRSTLQAVTHVDFSARVQTVDRERHPFFHRILTRFYEQTGCPALINTSFNVRGEPMVCTPGDAIRCFLATHMDALAVGSYLLLKSDQPESLRVDADAHLAAFALD